MTILERSYGGTTAVPVEAKLAEKRILFLEGEINDDMANEFSKSVAYLCEKKDPIKIVLNSRGGEVGAGLKICDTIAGCPSPISIYCFGQAFSMGAIVFESCKGKRYMVGHSKLMLHQPSVLWGSRQNVSEIDALSKDLKEKEQVLLEIVSKRTGISLSKLKKETASDKYYTGEEAVKANLADEVVDFSEILL